MGPTARPGVRRRGRVCGAGRRATPKHTHSKRHSITTVVALGEPRTSEWQHQHNEPMQEPMQEVR